MVFVTILRRFIHIDRETLEDMKYQSEIYVSIIGFSQTERFRFFVFIDSFSISVIFINCDEVFV